MCRYANGQDFMSMLCTVLVPGGPPWPRWLRFVGEVLRQPLAFLRLLNPIGWARRSGILLVMQSLPNHMSTETSPPLVLAVWQTSDLTVGLTGQSPQIHSGRQ